MDWDEAKQNLKPTSGLGEDLARHSIADLEARIATLETEVARVKSEIATRRKQSSAADALFKKA